MAPEIAAADQRLADLEAQIEGLCERHAQAVGELESRLAGWNDIEARLQRDATLRFHALERAIEQEWASLRSIHEAPARELTAQAANLTEICIATAGSAQTGLEKAEARLAALEAALHQRMNVLSREVHAAIAELGPRSESPVSRHSSAPWSLDEVTRLHDELRGAPSHLALRPVAGGPADAAVEHSTSPAARPRTLIVDADPAQPARSDRGRQLAVVGLALGLVFAAASAWFFYRAATMAAGRAAVAREQAERVAASAEQRIESARREAAEQIARARDAALKAQVTSGVLAAPDLIRFNLAGAEGAGTTAQLLWSRSRGFVLSGAHLAAPAAGMAYQMWLLTAGGAPVSAGMFLPDTSGRATLVTDTPPDIPLPVIGAEVTAEPSSGRPAPAGPVVLARRAQ
jgi:hypothetical protein